MDVKALSLPQLKSRLADLNDWIAHTPGGAALTEMDEERQEIEREIRFRGLPKLEARVVPYSSVVGSSIALHDPETGRIVASMPLLNVSALPGQHRDASEKLAGRVARALNNGFRAELVIAEMKRQGKLDAWMAQLYSDHAQEASS
jgi:hypothetical protein